MTIIAQGRRGTITRTGSIATKTANHPSVRGAIAKEYQIITHLNKEGIARVPQVIDRTDDGFSYTRIEGKHFKDVFKNASGQKKLSLLVSLLDRAYLLDTLGIVHGEFKRPQTNMLVRPDGSVAVIDFERGAFGDTSGKNMRDLAQRIATNQYLALDVLKTLGQHDTKTIYQILQQSLTGESGFKNQESGEENIIRDIESFSMFSSGLLTPISGFSSSFWFLVSSFLLIDFLTKYFFYDLALLSDTLLLTPVLNLGSAWSLPVPHWITRIVAGGIICYVLWSWKHNLIKLLPAAMIIAGALGNTYDRIVYDGVRDFIDLNTWISYPVFNGADIFLVCGVIIWCTSLLRVQSPKDV